MSEHVRRARTAVRPSAEALRKAAAGHLISALAGFLSALGSVMGFGSPFGIAFCAAAPGEYVLAAGIGSVLGYLVRPGGLGDPFRTVTAVFAAATLKWILSGILRLTKGPLFCVLLALGTSFLSEFLLTSDLTPTDVLRRFAFCLLACGAAYFFNRGIDLLFSKRKPGNFSVRELSCLAVCLTLAVTGLIPLSVFGISPVKILCVVFVLCAARYGREAFGAVSGICVGFAAALSSAEFTPLFAAYAFGGLIAGMLAPVGSVAVIGGFVLSTGILAVRFLGEPGTLPGLYEIFLGSFLFLLIPTPFGQKLVDWLSPCAEIPGTDELRKTLVMRLRSASAALSDVSQTVEEVSAKLRNIDAPDFENIFVCVENDVCAGCGMRVYCWESAKADTLAALMEVIKGIRAGSSAADSLPESFAKRCSRPNTVSESVLVHYNDHIAKESAMRRIDEVRSVVSDQFEGISDMLYDMSEEFETARHCDPEAAELAERALRGLGILCEAVTCTVDKFNRMNVDIIAKTPSKERINRAVIMKELSQILCRDFDVPCISAAGGKTHIGLSEKANYTVDFGAAQFACSGARMCGDAYRFFHDGRGRAVAILSDGMGNGGRAAVDGAMASGLMARLIKAGFGFDCALKIVNSAMLFKSADESLATVDISCVDLFTGRTELLKAGAPPTLVRRNGRTGRAECSSLPAGILRDIGFDSAAVTLNRGDIVLMISDGATSEGTDWICAELEAWRHGDAQALAQHIASCARRRRSGRHEDDITVLAMILEDAA